MRSNLTVSLDHELKLKFRDYCHNARKFQGVVLENLILEMFKKEELRSPVCQDEETGYLMKETNNV